MKNLKEEHYTSEIIIKALHNLLRRKEYHLAPPLEKDKLIMQECARIHYEKISVTNKLLDDAGV
jgi:hypothetical protein